MADTGRDVLAALGGGLANLPTCRLSDLLGSRKVGDLERWRAGVEKRGMGRLGRVRWGGAPPLLGAGGVAGRAAGAGGGYRVADMGRRRARAVGGSGSAAGVGRLAALQEREH